MRLPLNELVVSWPFCSTRAEWARRELSELQKIPPVQWKVEDRFFRDHFTDRGVRRIHRHGRSLDSYLLRDLADFQRGIGASAVVDPQIDACSNVFLKTGQFHRQCIAAHLQLRKAKLPSWSDAAMRVSFVPSLVTLTAAPCTGAPEESVTVPRICAVVV